MNILRISGNSGMLGGQSTSVAELSERNEMSTSLLDTAQTHQKISVEESVRGPEEDAALSQRLADTLAHPKPPRMTYEEFLEWANEDTLAEWVDGEAVMTSPASRRHQDVVGFLFEVLRAYVRPHNLGEVIQAPFQMKLKHGREPDLLFVAEEHLERLKETHLDGPADLVIEIVSPESLDRDRGARFAEYETGGILEYWLLDPLRRWAEFYQLGQEGRYEVAFVGREGIYASKSLPGFWLRVEWLWQEPLPPPLLALGEIAKVDTQVIQRFLQALGGKE